MTVLASGPVDGAWSESLAPGEVLAGRYRIVGFLGRGAVGEVYEAFDQELDDAIAIKVLRPEIARDERVLQRFKREIQLGRRVTHPNVCRVFDLVYHWQSPPAPEAPPDKVLLTMELLRGETLEQLLARQGRMSTAEALPVIGHIVAALTAAHNNGVIHRDLKSGNIFLVPAASGMRAVVTDFGLAWSSIEANDSANLTATGELVGSPAYMAPEQVRGEEATVATDVYALGVVIFEMVTGELPFVGKSAFYTALKRLQEPAPSPRIHLSDLDPAWETTILRCLEREPEKRFPSVHHVVRALGLTKAEEDATSPLRLVEGQGRRRPRRRGRTALALGLAAALLAVGGFWWVWQSSRAAPARAGAVSKPAPPIPVRPVVAVLPFDNLAPGAGETTGYAGFELLPLELAATGKVRVVPAEEVDWAVRELTMADSARLPDSTLPRLRERLSADFLVTGVYLPGPAGTRWEVALRDRAGRTVRTFSESGDKALESLSARLRRELGAGEPAGIDAESLRALRPKRTAELWAEALHRLRRGEAPMARDLLLRAVKTDPDNPLLHSALADVLADLGKVGEAEREAKKAVGLAAVLRREDWLPLEARYHEVAKAWEEAAGNWQQIFAARPDDLEAGLRLAAAQTEEGRPSDAASTLARLHRLPAPVATDPRIDIVESKAAFSSLQYPRAKAAAERAARRAEALGARRLAGQARLAEAGALVMLGDLTGAARSTERARQAYAAAGDPWGVAEALRQLGRIRSRRGDLAGAQAAYDDALALYRRLSATGRMAQTLREAGAQHFGAGDLDRAESLYRQGLELAKRVGDRRAQAALLHNIAIILRQRGRLPEAKELFRQTLALHRELGFAKGEAASLEGLSAIALSEGDLMEARLSLQLALAIYRRQESRDAAAEALDNMANISLELGDLAQSRRLSEQARAEAQAAHREEGVARADRGIANVLRQQGDVAAARKLYEQSLLTYQRLSLPAREAEVLDEIGGTLTLQGDLVEALQRFQDALAGARKQASPRAEVEVLLHQGQAFRRFGEPHRAASSLKQAVALCRQRGVPSIEAWALVEIGNVQRDQGDLAAAQRSFEAALAIFRRRGARSGMAAAQAGLGAVHLVRGELAQARKLHEEALETRADLGEKLAAAESRLSLAEVALAGGQAGQAGAAARAAAAEFRALANPPGERAAILLLARCLLAQNKTAAAREVLASSGPLLDGSQEPAVKNAAAELRSRAAVGSPGGIAVAEAPSKPGLIQ
jgi:tetratricopeptide (TPR) repeat protein